MVTLTGEITAIQGDVMSEVITQQDREYESMEHASAPGASQPMQDRVNNRSLRPNSPTFKKFMTTGWDNQEPDIQPLESSRYTGERLRRLGERFPGERIVIPAGQPKAVPYTHLTLPTRYSV